jgi:hypothetical protein
MKVSGFSDELYREFDWRFDEIRRLQNLITQDRNRDDRDELRKSLIVVLYAHFEGFCVFALEHYLASLNSFRLSCRNAASSIVAGAWELLFNAMEHGDEKCKLFTRPLPNDPYLHRHWRRRHFVEEIDRFWKFPVQLDERVIDSESNLKPEVLQRNLFILGLDHKFVEPLAANLRNLLSRRNRIAHGDDRRPVLESEYYEYESTVFEICYQMIEFLNDSIANEAYQKSEPDFLI